MAAAPMPEGGRDRAVAGHASPGQDRQLSPLARVLDLGPGDGQHEAVGVLGDLVDGERGQLGAAEGGHEAGQEQGPVPQAGQVVLGLARGRLPDPGPRAPAMTSRSRGA